MEKALSHYIGTKRIQASKMTLGEYNIYRGWDIPADENPNKEGYLVVYPGGYESWSPKETFEETYRSITAYGLTISQATNIMKSGDGLGITRAGWNGKEMFAVYREGYPEGVECNADHAKAWNLEEGEKVVIRPYFQLRCADGTLANWTPTTSDILAEDWGVVYSGEQYEKIWGIE